MIVNITYRCSMGCTHCLSDCKPDGADIPISLFENVLEFMVRNEIPNWIFSGGEMFEHPEILKLLEIIGQYIDSRTYVGPVTFITNGRKLARSSEIYEAVSDFQKKRKKSLTIIQVTDDKRFYPDPLTTKEIWRLKKLDAFIDTVPGNPNDPNQCLYPQGRALINYPNAKWNMIGPKCANCVSIAKIKAKTFKELIHLMFSVNRYCTPMIDPNGNIKLGESALCPEVASIWDDDSVIMEKIKNHHCKGCEIAWDNLKKVAPVIYYYIMNE